MAKFCSNCGKELDENAAMCLNCGVLVGNTMQNNINNTNKEKKKGLPTWAIVLIIIGSVIIVPIICVTILAVRVFNVIGETDFNFNEIIEETIIKEGTIGDTLITDTFEITLDEVKKYDSVGEEYYLKKPEEGKEYLVFFFSVKNISSDNEFISSYDFDGYADGYTEKVIYLYSNIEGVGELSTNLAPGKITKGYVAFEVDKTWQEFEIHFSEWFDTSELVFNVVNNTNSNSNGI